MTIINVCMRVAGLSVPEVVREIITRNRSIYDCMKMDLINYTALAVKIQPEVEKLIGNQVNLNTIVVAIKRYADSFEEKNEITSESFLKNAKLSLTDGIVDIKLSPASLGNIDPFSILNKFSEITSDYEFFRLADSFRVLTVDDDEIRQLIQTLPNNENFLNTGLARIKISVPSGQKRSVGSLVSEVLHENGIDIVDAYFSQENIIIILNGKDASRAYEILRAVISR